MFRSPIEGAQLSWPDVLGDPPLYVAHGGPSNEASVGSSREPDRADQRCRSSPTGSGAINGSRGGQPVKGMQRPTIFTRLSQLKIAEFERYLDWHHLQEVLSAKGVRPSIPDSSPGLSGGVAHEGNQVVRIQVWGPWSPISGDHQCSGPARRAKARD